MGWETHQGEGNKTRMCNITFTFKNVHSEFMIKETMKDFLLLVRFTPLCGQWTMVYMYQNQ